MADISNKVVAILLVLVIIVAALGTWAFLSAFTPVGTNVDTSSSGEVNLKVAEQTGPLQSASDAAVELRIAPREGQ